MAKDKTFAEELDFISAAKLLESPQEEKKEKIAEQLYNLLTKNKEAFIFATTEEILEPTGGRGRDSAANIQRILKVTLKNTQKLTEDQEIYLRKVFKQLQEGGIPKQTTKSTMKALNDLKSELVNPFKVLAVLQTYIPEKFLDEHYAEQSTSAFGKREVILSLYLKGEITMDNNQARNIIKDTFENAFDENKFRNFVKNLLNHIDTADNALEKQGLYGNYIPDMFKRPSFEVHTSVLENT